MLRVIFDTNIYGNLLKREDYEQLKERIVRSNNIIVYGYSEIRKELRNIPKLTPESRKTRVALLGLYDSIIRDRNIIHTKEIVSLAKRYHTSYVKIGGNHSWQSNFREDLMIVAAATLNILDIVFSADNKTMLNTLARKAYQSVNKKKKLKTPKFIEYNKMIERINELF